MIEHWIEIKLNMAYRSSLSFVALDEYIRVHTHLVKDGLVGAEEAPLDVSVPEADVEDLAVGLGIGVVAVGAAVAGEAQIGRDLEQVLGQDQAGSKGTDRG